LLMFSMLRPVGRAEAAGCVSVVCEGERRGRGGGIEGRRGGTYKRKTSCAVRGLW